MKSIYNVNSCFVFFFYIYILKTNIYKKILILCFKLECLQFPHYVIAALPDLLVYKGMVSTDVVQ